MAGGWEDAVLAVWNIGGIESPVRHSCVFPKSQLPQYPIIPLFHYPNPPIPQYTLFPPQHSNIPTPHHSPARLHETVEDSVCGEELRREVSKMSRTMADVLIERGWTSGRTEGRTEAAIETRQQTLLRQLRRRFDDVPPEVTQAINATTATEQLDDWLDQVLTANSLEEMGF